MLNKIKFTYEVSNNQTDLFTRSHKKYKCVIKYNNKQYTFDYQCNAKYTPTLEDCVDCLLLDCFSYDDANDLYGFANDLGYELSDSDDIKKVKRIYNACKKTSVAIHRIFTDNELDELQKTLYKDF